MSCQSRSAFGLVLLLAACTSTQEAPQVPVTDDPEAPVAAEPAPAPSPEPAGSAAGGAANAEPAVSLADTAPAAPSTPTTQTPVADAPPAAPTEAAKPPGLKVKETRTIAVIRQIVLNNRQQFRDCYEAERRGQPGLKGSLTLHFKLNPAGQVSLAEVNLPRSSLKSPKLASCALAALRRLQFPSSSRGFESEVNYPFDFR
jgi:outer membrane biosynthesis protein TonB